MTATPLPPLDWVAMLKEAIGIIKGKPTYKRFIDGTPLDNDVPVWMADFAMQHATAARADLEAEVARLREALHRIDSIAVFLPTFDVLHEGGIEAVTQNIVKSISKAVAALEKQP